MPDPPIECRTSVRHVQPGDDLINTSSQDDLEAEKAETSTTLQELHQRIADKENDRADAHFKAEIDRLRSEL